MSKGVTTNGLPMPMLPGYNPTYPQREKHHKAHIFDIKQGTMLDFDAKVQDPKDHRDASTGPRADLINRTQTIAQNVTEAKKLNRTDATSTLSSLPTWVEFDRKVLRYYCYFIEAVVSSQVEKQRVRKCVLYYYLDDNTLHIAEPKIENSGIPQGVFVKRHRVPTHKGDRYITPEDLSFGSEIAVYGRIFRIIDSDEFTKQFHDAIGRPLGDPESHPVDEFTQKNMHVPETRHKAMHPFKEYMEARLGKPMLPSIAATQQFLNNDGKVLRFYALWDDTDTYGEKRPYVLHYFLADDTIEVLEVRQPNSGRDPFPCFLSRSKVPKKYEETVNDVIHIGFKGDHRTNYYTVTDLRIGGRIQVYGRDLKVVGCDAFTREFYKANFHMDDSHFPVLPEMVEAEELLPVLSPPEYNGFGTEEDSLGSYLFLQPKVPKRDYKKFIECDGIKLRYLAQFVNPSPADKERRFIVIFFVNDGTLGIFERYDRNSGFVGGKFLERQRIKNEQTNDFFKIADLKFNQPVVINKFAFLITECDQYTSEFLKNNLNHIS